MTEHALPLSDITVVEVGSFIAAPYATMQLADLGARVIKVEPPGQGDFVRGNAPFIGGESSSFLRLNRNKESVELDLKSDQGQAMFRELARRADVVFENLRPGRCSGWGSATRIWPPRTPGLSTPRPRGGDKTVPLHTSLASTSWPRHAQG